MRSRAFTLRPPSRRARLLAAALLAALLLLVGWIVLQPGPPAGHQQAGLVGWLREAHQHGLPGWITFGLIEWLSNVVMFAPLGFLGALALRGRRWRVPLVGLLLSGAIETTQTLLLPGRDGSALDVLANTVGALLGTGLAVAVLRIGRRPGRSAPPGQAGPNGSADRPTRSATESTISDGRNG